MSSPERAELMRNALAFLTDPKSQGSSLTQRVQFLEAKGLTPSEIEDVLRQASLRQSAPVQSIQYQGPYQYGSPPYPAFGSPPAQQPLDWRDYFGSRHFQPLITLSSNTLLQIMTVVSGTFALGAVSLARKYLMPHLRPPTSTAYEADRDALAEQFDAAEKMLKEIQSETAAMRQAVDEQKLKVEQTTQDVDACVKELHEGEARTRDEMREIREEVNSIREMLPKMIEKNKESQTQSLGELQQELKSLKALLMSRGPGHPTTPSPSLFSSVGRPSIPAWQLAGSGSSEPPVPTTSNQPSHSNGTNINPQEKIEIPEETT